MNLASQAGEPDRKLLFVNFNQNYTSLAVGTKTGYKLYSLDSIDKLEPIYCSEHERQVCIIERLFVSSLIALVSLDSPRKLKVCHFKKGTEICNYSYSNSILAVRLNRQRLVVCLEESLYIHNIRDMKVMHTIKETPPNPRGLCVLSTGNDDSYLAYPGSSQNGNVQVFDTLKLRCVTSLHAHDNPIAALAFNSSGSRLATASEKGTVIRVFSIPDGAKLFDFRRGMKRCVSISSLAFSADSLYVAAASNTETVHVFKLEKKEDKPAADDAASQGWAGYVTQALRSSASYLPSQVTDVFNQWRSFATAHLPNPAQKAVCGIAVIQKAPRMLVATEEGNLYVYNLDPKDGGECVLVKTLRIDEIRPPAISEPPLPASAVDRPLTATTPVNVATVTYAASVRRNDSSNVLARSPTAGPHNAVGLLSHDNSSFYSLAPASTNQTAAAGGASAAAAARVASSGAAEHLAGTLRLDDASEFPPMTPGYD